MVLATTMVGQAKTVLQAEIDAACELIDFYRFATQYAEEIYSVSQLNGGWQGNGQLCVCLFVCSKICTTELNN